MYHLQSEKIVKALYSIMKIIDIYIYIKKDDPVQTPDTPNIDDFVLQSQIHLLLQIAFC